MTKVTRSIPALGAVFFALLGLSACGGSSSVPSNAVAKVEETPVTQAAFKHWIGVAAVSSASGPSAGRPVLPEPPDYTACIAHLKEVAEKELAAKSIKRVPAEAKLKSVCESQYKTFKQEVMSFLLSSQWVIGEAKSLGINLSDSEVRKQFLKIKSEQFPKAGEFEKFIAASGQTVSDLLLRVKLNLLSSKIQSKIAKEKGTVSDAELEKYYNENKSRYGSPEKRDANLILTKGEAEAQAAKKEIESGQSFATVAKKRSIDTTSKANGGMVTGIVKGQEAVALDRALFTTPVHVLSGPVKTGFGYYVYEVTSITPGSQQSFTQAKPAIKAQLTATKNQESLSKFVKNFKKKWLAKTDCQTDYVVADCKQYKAPKTSGATGEGASGASGEG
ncbi:MAG TPA: peptidyl-prolyl cis-trans isomerase [Solirubrobacteraceae bacterium]|nr:peptidyl-prolyl cis-trans isomerase [Solirubrobacteraceae bacterium]HME04647.1 peptidyl-prolyl cis-trans isomerase [Solirubrobacteraceae bacterium]